MIDIDLKNPLSKHSLNRDLTYCLMGLDGYVMGERFHPLTNNTIGLATGLSSSFPVKYSSTKYPYLRSFSQNGGATALDITGISGPAAGSYSLLFYLQSRLAGADRDAQNIFSSDSYNLYASVGGQKFNVYRFGWVVGTVTTPLNKPFAVGISYDAGSGIVYTYVNGVLDRTNALAASSFGATVILGKRVDGYPSGGTWTGDFLVFRYYKGRVLSAIDHAMFYDDCECGFKHTLNRVEYNAFKSVAPLGGVGLIGNGLVNNSPLIESNIWS